MDKHKSGTCAYLDAKGEFHQRVAYLQTSRYTGRHVILYIDPGIEWIKGVAVC